ncbi:MAG: Mut7-C RNAse domain-containing protein [Deltaproteobacteria bacterium]|nr:Mut7-C RNAse domain-containing protein [Deltaproteobacteria bacterium]
MNGREEDRGAPPRFFADAMLGSLARWLRTLGADVEYDSRIDDSTLIQRAIKEGRIILTRDTRLAKRKVFKDICVFIEKDSVDEQLRQVAGRFRIGMSGFLTRCLRCNALLEAALKTSVRDNVPPYVYETQGEFSRCARCGRVYWGGTHRERMLEELSRMLG